MKNGKQSEKVKEKEFEDNWNKATLANNFIFYKVMRNHHDACQHLLEMLLNIKIRKMEIHNEETIDLDHDGKGIRLDVFVKEARRMHDIELQVVDTKELPKRARYYAGLMALDTLKNGEPYKKLRDAHVIFICMEDIFKKKLPIYSFENLCKEDTKIKLNDRDFKYFFIAPTCAKMLKDKEIKSFFDFLVTGKPSSGFTKELEGYVAEAKQNLNYKRQFMEWERQKAYEYRKGMQEAKLEAARNFLAEGIVPEIIARCTGLPLEEVQKLAEETCVTKA